MRTRTAHSATTLAASFKAGDRIYLPGGCGESVGFTAALCTAPQLTRGLHVVTTFVPGINKMPLERMADDLRVSALFMQPGAAASGRRFDHLPVSYAGFVRDLRDRWTFDAAVLHVSPPDEEGYCSLGAAAEFNLLAASKSRRVIAVINPGMPRIALAPQISVKDVHELCEIEGPLPVYDPGRPDDAAIAIAGLIAGLVPDGATLQIGIGKVPAALCGALRDHRGLKFWSGLLSDGWLELSRAGALANAVHVCCAAIGSPAFYQSIAHAPDLRVAGCETTHDLAALASVDGFISVNSALQVDLFGQCNLECAGGAMVSGPGGAPDFARAAARGRGVSVVALPATAGRSPVSRIVAQLDVGLVTLGRQDVDVVVTEYGVADLRGRTASQRAAALVSIAAPAFQDDLAHAWRDRGVPKG